LNSLTSLRYLAAAAVVVTHVNPYFLSSHVQQTATFYWYVGVAFFFMLSGFVLTWSCSRQRAGAFWWNRFSRIYPLQLLMMAVTYVLLWSYEPHPSNGVGWGLQALLLQGWDPNNNVHSGGNGVTWSLSCEFFFYAMFPLLIMVVRRLRARGLLVTAAAVVAAEAAVPAVVGPHVSPAMYEWLFFYLPGYRIGEFILGMLLARAVALGLRFRLPSAGYAAGWAWFAVWVVVSTEYTLHHHGDAIPRPFVTLMVMPAFALLVLAGASADLSGRTRLLGKWLPVKLGEWSFALYMVHATLAELIRVYDWIPRLSGAGTLVLFIAGCTVVAALAHYGVEKPVERWLRHHMPRFRRPPSGPEDACGVNHTGRHRVAPLPG
jgi:peptidoglycan/LPS O-acetylase OafA/YrhL